jgi:hypothetical protein
VFPDVVFQHQPNIFDRIEIRGLWRPEKTMEYCFVSSRSLFGVIGEWRHYHLATTIAGQGHAEPRTAENGPPALAHTYYCWFSIVFFAKYLL